MGVAAEPIEQSWYSYADLQERWGVSRQTIWREVRAGRLKASRVRGAVRFARRVVEAYERKHT